jgi:endoribonuclease LACTB2
MKIVDAVTAVLMHEGELLMTRRQPALAAFGGFWAFPGGKVDGDDHQAVCSRALQARVPATAAPLLCALARELMEELGIDLNALADAGAIAAVTDLGTALTPPISPLRYNTHFFRIDLHTRPALTVDTRETDTAEWAPPQQLMQRYGRGQLLLGPPCARWRPTPPAATSRAWTMPTVAATACACWNR